MQACHLYPPTQILSSYPFQLCTSPRLRHSSVSWIPFRQKTNLEPTYQTKRQELNRRFGQLYRLLNRKSNLSIENKLLIYKTILKPIWTYGLELWGTTKFSNIKRIQSFQSKVLRMIVNAPYYVTNKTLHHDLYIPYILDVIPSRFSNFHMNLIHHPNPLAQSLSSSSHPYNPPRRLKRQWPRDLL